MKKLFLSIATLFLITACGHTPSTQDLAPLNTENPEITAESLPVLETEVESLNEPAEIAEDILEEITEISTTIKNQEYSLVAEESEFFWRGETPIKGHEGIILIESGNLTKSGGNLSGDFVIDMNNIAVTDIQGQAAQGLIDHLKNEDFFNVTEFPTSKFSITKSNKLAENKYTITGDLTIKGITNPITFDMEFAPIEDRLLGLSDFTIDRTLWDVQYGSGKFFENLGDNLIGDDIIVKLTLTFQ